MLNKLTHNIGRIALLSLLTLGLVIIRTYEDSLFYDPFLNYFKENYFHLPIPKIDYFRLFLGLFFRYFLNSSISLAIIYIIFRDRTALQFTAFLYFVLFVIIVVTFFILLFQVGETNKMGLFYSRRFLIQPIFLLLFIPAFYYQNKRN